MFALGAERALQPVERPDRSNAGPRRSRSMAVPGLACKTGLRCQTVWLYREGLAPAGKVPKRCSVV